MKTIRIQEVIKKKRLERNLSQEALAEAFGISVQAVSKWENGLSYPDITVLPKICDYFNINMEELFFCDKGEIINELPDDDIFRVVQCLGNRVLSKEDYNDGKRIKLAVPQRDTPINIDIWGSADIKGDVRGNVSAGDGVNCGGVGGNVSAGDGVNCGGVQGNVTAGDGINCGGVGGSVIAGDSINCGGIDGDAKAESGGINCGNIKGNATAKLIKCKKIGGDVNCDKVIIKKHDDDEDED